MPESKTSPRRIAAVDKQRQALELRMAGRRWQEIAQAVGYASHSGAIAAVNAALEKTLKEPADRHRALTIERLTKLLATYWPAMLAGVTHVEGTNQWVLNDTKAAGVCLGAIDRIRALLGLDAKAPVPGSSRDNPLWTQSTDAIDLSGATDAELDEIIEKAKAIQEAGNITRRQLSTPVGITNIDTRPTKSDNV